MTASSPHPTIDQAAGLPAALVAWVDGVGAFLLLTMPRVTIGGASGRADVRLSASLPAEHAVIDRSGEGYVLAAHAPVLVAPRQTSSAGGAGRVVDGRTDLSNGDELVLFRETYSGDLPGVRLRFSQPNALTATALLSVLGDRRTEPRFDGIVLLAEVCVFGAGTDAHIRCRTAEEAVLLFRRNGGIWVRSNGSLAVNGVEVATSQPVGPGDIIRAPGVSFRLETASGGCEPPGKGERGV